MLEIKEVQNKKDLKLFIQIQYDLYNNSPHFVPPLKMDRKKLLDKEKNPFWKQNDRSLFIAFKDGKAVGRIAAIENKMHNKIHEDNCGFFGFFDSINDQEIAHALFSKAAEWNKTKGFNRMRGPVNPHLNDDSPGFLVDNYNDDPLMLMAYTHPYYLELAESWGFKKAKDLYAYWVDTVNVANIDKMQRIVEKSAERHQLNFRSIDFKNFDSEYLIIQDIFNKAWEQNWGNIPFTKEDFEYIASDLKSLVHKDFITLAFKENTAIGMAVAFPDINELIKNMKGRLLTIKAVPFFKYLLNKKVTMKRMRIIILGVLPEYDHTGATAMLYLKLYQTAKKYNLLGGEMSWILEDNEKMNKAAKMLGADVYKTYRILEKPLN